MNPELSPQEISLEAARRAVLRRAATLAGAAFLSAALSRTAFAQDATAATPATPPADAAMPPATPEAGMMDMTTGTYRSILDEPGNPNHPEKTIPASAKSATDSDVDILNFALTLERLEADFYARVVEANTARPYLSPRVGQIAATLASDEASHVQAILDILRGKGATPTPEVRFQFPTNVFVSPIGFLDLAATFEVTGTGAYLGQAPNVQSRDVLKFAASVYGVEARHTGLIRFVGGLNFSPSDTETPLQKDEVLRRVQPFIIA